MTGLAQGDVVSVACPFANRGLFYLMAWLNTEHGMIRNIEPSDVRISRDLGMRMSAHETTFQGFFSLTYSKKNSFWEKLPSEVAASFLVARAFSFWVSVFRSATWKARWVTARRPCRPPRLKTHQRRIQNEIKSEVQVKQQPHFKDRKRY